jgi:class 3 adenylate cyclase
VSALDTPERPAAFRALAQTRGRGENQALEPRIEYARTADGVGIALWKMGDGPPFVSMPPVPFDPLDAERQVPELARWLERMLQTVSLVRYDHRGSGLSQRDIAELSLDAFVLDVEAVVDHLALERFALLTSTTTGPIGIAYAVRHPDRVSHLILGSTFANGREFFASPQGEALLALVERDWRMFTETSARVAMGWSEEAAGRWAAMIRAAVTPEQALAFLRAFAEFDVSELLHEISVPTLVVHRKGVQILDTEVVRRLAARIPRASLVLLEGDSAAPWMGDVDEWARTVEEFLGIESPRPAPEPTAPGLVTILFTDIEGSTQLTQRLGDARARAILRECERVTREALDAHGGMEVKTMGDGFVAWFSSASSALACASALQRAFAEGDLGLRVRIGLNAGEPIAESEDLFGTAVILAARLADQARGGEIFVSDVVRQLAAGKGFVFADRGETTLRGFDEPVRAFELHWQAIS